MHRFNTNTMSIFHLSQHANTGKMVKGSTSLHVFSNRIGCLSAAASSSNCAALCIQFSTETSRRIYVRHRSDSECQQTASPVTIIGHSIGLLTSGADELFREEGSATYIHTRLVNRSSATLTGPTLWMRNRPAHMRQASALTREKGTCHPV